SAATSYSNNSMAWKWSIHATPSGKGAPHFWQIVVIRVSQTLSRLHELLLLLSVVRTPQRRSSEISQTLPLAEELRASNWPSGENTAEQAYSRGILQRAVMAGILTR